MIEQANPLPAPLETDAVPRVPAGEQLRRAREACGMTVQDVAQTLKLGIRQVEALEAGDWHQLPGATFIRGFVRNYARILQLDAAPLMAALDRVLERTGSNLHVPETRPAAMPTAGRWGGRRDRNVVFLGLGLVALAAASYFLMPNDLSGLHGRMQGLLDAFSRQEATAEAPAASPAEPVFPPGTTPQQVMNPQATAPAEEKAAAAPVLPAPPVVPVTPLPALAPAPVETSAPVADAAPVMTPSLRFVFDKESWLDVRDRDNRSVVSQRLSAGAEQTVGGRGPFSIVIGYAPGVRVFWRGQPVDLAPHTKGDVARLVLE